MTRWICAVALLLACGDDDGAEDMSAPSDAAQEQEVDTAVAMDAAESDAEDAAEGGGQDVAIDVALDTAMTIGSSGCLTGVPLDDGEHTVTIGERERRYMVRVPEGYSAERAWPVIFALHGNGGNPGYWDGDSADRNIREAFGDEAILIIPEAIDNAWRNYDADRSTWPALIEEELAFFDATHERMLGAFCVNEDAVFSMGFSGGGSFSGLLGCRRDYIRAIGVGGSVIYFDDADGNPEESECTHTPAAWITIGQDELATGRERFRDFFVDLAGCDAAPAPNADCLEYSCPDETPVIYCTHPAGHVWPAIGTDATRTFFRQFYASDE